MKNTLLYILLIVCGVNLISAQCFTRLSAGTSHTIALKPNGTLWSWGLGGFGQLGNGSQMSLNAPTQITTATNWQSVTAGGFYSLAIKTNGTLWSTGDNFSGQLGIGSAATFSNTFVQVGTATNWKQVASGFDFTLGVRTDGSLWGWGQNDTNQMGDGSCCGNRLSPGQIGTATDWKMVDASETRTGMAIKNNGTLWGWGFNSSTGLLGPSTLGGLPVPTQIGTANNWATISMGSVHVVALKTDGTLWSWGSGGRGQTGDNLSPSFFRDTPLQIGTATWSKVVAGSLNSLGIQPNGTLWAWGFNETGQLGDGTTEIRRVPIQIGTDTDWADVTSGRGHTVALKTNGALWAWGYNFFGQLGNGSTTDTLIPVNVPVAGCSLRVDGFEKEPLTVYPNPAQNEITIRYQGSEVVTGLVIYDIAGRAVYTSNPAASANLQATLPITMLQSGTYIITLVASGTTVVRKRFVKE